MPAPASRVLFLGLDGGTMRVLGPAFERGWLPNLASIWRRAAHGSLRSSEPMVTPVAWTSFATGCMPPTHGIHEFYHLDPFDRSIRPNHAGRVRVPTLWQVFDALRRPIISLGLPMTYPPPRVRGLVVAGSDAPGLEWAFAQCPGFGREILKHVPNYTHKIVWKRRPRRLDELQSTSARNQGVFRAQAEVALRADARCPEWAAMMVHFHNLDGLQHRLWPYLAVDETAIHQRDWNREVIDCLQSLDDAIGRLAELASSRDAAIVALSDHGFGPCRKLVNVNGLLRNAGLQRGLSYGMRFRYRAHRLADRLNRWKARRSPGGVPARSPRSIEGQLGCDWKRTIAFAPFGQLSGCVFLNPRTVHGESAATRFRRELIDVFLDSRDPATGDVLFADAFDVADRYDVDPAEHGLPDVLALSADGYQAQAKWSPFHGRIVREEPNLPATHYVEGVLAIDGPDIRPGGHLKANLQDIAPTVLAMLGLPVPEFMEGRVLHEAFENPLPVRQIPGPVLEPDPESESLLAAVGLGGETL